MACGAGEEWGGQFTEAYNWGWDDMYRCPRAQGIVIDLFNEENGYSEHPRDYANADPKYFPESNIVFAKVAGPGEVVSSGGLQSCTDFINRGVHNWNGLLGVGRTLPLCSDPWQNEGHPFKHCNPYE